jgi:hypothetical protein
MLRMWTYDLAREQCPTIEHLRALCRLTVNSGYDALGLYLEHRFAYPSTPWAHGKGALTPESVRTLVQEFPQIEIVPFINVLGHFEGFLYTEFGMQFAEEKFQGMQACPSNSKFVALVHEMVEDVLQVFPSELIHIGGDETQQLGRCPACQSRVSTAEKSWGVDGKAVLYAEHFAPVADQVLASGRRPAFWGDMFLEHPQALDRIPKESLIFNWQYFEGARESSQTFIDAGHEVVLCPTLHTYNAPWFHMEESEDNLRRLSQDAQVVNAYGICLTTWELGLFGSYDSLFPAIGAAPQIMADPAASSRAFYAAYGEAAERFELWAELMAVDLQRCDPVFAFSRIRSSLKARFMLYSNPFLLWLHHRQTLAGEAGSCALKILEEALRVAPNEESKGVTIFVRCAVEFVRLAEEAHNEYARGNAEGAIFRLSLTRQLFDHLAKVARQTNQRVGGSFADIERCRAAREHVERVIVRIRNYGTGELGYLPSFEMISHPKFIPHDQAGWWLINSWANQ